MKKNKADRSFAFICLGASMLLLAAVQYAWLAPTAIRVVATANLLLYGLTLFLFRRTRKSFTDPNLHVSVRAIMSGFMIKFFVLAVAALVYIFSMRKEVSLPALGAVAVLYIVYTGAEVRALLLLLKKTDHA
ncbi:MAG: hypothetical protein ACKOA3_03610 [Sphingomonadales bacterium]|nr:hypothetical protein [Sphingomonadales bacterium]